MAENRDTSEQTPWFEQMSPEVHEAVLRRDSEWRTALNRMLSPECPAFRGLPNACDPAACDCLGELQDCFTIEEVVTALRPHLTKKPVAGDATGSTATNRRGEETPKAGAPNGHRPDSDADHHTTQTQEAQ